MIKSKRIGKEPTNLLDQQIKSENRLKYINNTIKDIDTQNKKLNNDIEYQNQTIDKKEFELKNIQFSIEEDNKIDINFFQNIEKLDKNTAQKIQQLQSEKEKLKNIDRELQHYNIEELKDKEQKIEKEIQSYIDYKRLLDEKIRVEKKLKRIVPTLQEKEKRLRKYEQDLPHKEEIFRYQIEIASLKEQRNRLKRGEACPLCGSTLHPKIEEYRRVEPLPLEIEIKNIKQEMKELNSSLKELRDNRSRYKSTLESIQHNVKKPINIDIDEYNIRKERIKSDILKYKQLKGKKIKVVNQHGNIDLKIAKLMDNV